MLELERARRGAARPGGGASSCRPRRWRTRSRCACSASPATSCSPRSTRTSCSTSSAGRPSTPGLRHARPARASAAGSRPTRFAAPSATTRTCTSAHARRRRSRTRTTRPAAASGRSRRSTPSPRRCRELGLAVHLDGARLMNAAVALGRAGGGDRPPLRHRHALPVEGARLPARRARRRIRGADGEAPGAKFLFGGAMRQAGIVAAAGALRARPPPRPARRRPRARAAARRGLVAAGLPVDLEQVETNFVQLDVGAARPDDAPRRSRGCATPASACRTRSTRTSCAPSRTSTSATRTSSGDRADPARARRPCAAPDRRSSTARPNAPGGAAACRA